MGSGSGDSNVYYPDFMTSPIIYIAIIILSLIALAIIAYILILRRRDKSKLPKAIKTRLLLIKVPKEIGKGEKEEKQDEKELIAVAEQVFVGLNQLHKVKKAKIWEEKDFVAFEIVSYQNETSFYVCCPEHLAGLVEKQIQSAYPKVELEEVSEYNFYQSESAVAATNMILSRDNVFPIKTYKNLENDPLSSLANALSKMDKNEGGGIQIILRPAKEGWRTRGMAAARKVQQGVRPGDAVGGKSVAGKMAKFAGEIVTTAVSGPSSKKAPEVQGQKQVEAPPSLTPMQQETVKALEEKANKVAFETNIRLVVASVSREQAEIKLSNLINAFGQFNYPEFNHFQPDKNYRKKETVTNFNFRFFDQGKSSILNAEELASIFHLPTAYTETPEVKWLAAKKGEAPPQLPEEGLTVGKNVFRGVERLVRVPQNDRRRHLYIIGQTGTGKTTLLKNMIAQDLQNGEGLCVVDPHGELIEDLLGVVPAERAEDVIIFDPGDIERPLGLNMLEYYSPEQKDFVVNEMIAIFHKLFPPEVIGPMFEHNMRNVMLTLMADPENPGTITEIPRMFTDPEYQKAKIEKLTDPVVRDFWEKEMAKTTDFHKSEMLGYLISKVGQFVENTMMRNILGQPYSAFNLREIMDENKILFANLSKGKTGEINSSLLGLILVSKIQMAAMGRADMPEEERKDFFLYIDEFQNFTTDSIMTILSEARKYRLNLTLAHQYIAQLPENIRDAVFGNVGNLVSFRIGPQDAEFVEKQTEPVFSAHDLINLGQFQTYAKLSINNTPTKAFSMQTLPPEVKPDREWANKVKELSRLKYGKDRAEVEAKIWEQLKPRNNVETVSPPEGKIA
ncbi:hypothetical protein COT68_00685 [bacterium (Candidatus Torokbacteria) CG09_land_8_20_14_0_10_42_11]|nr:MAG: hypothetical protein COT68_00685 [bacterium (Candidatus Torokbacteria) CG09_land_8_20_14_0_10_42_11]